MSVTKALAKMEGLALIQKEASIAPACLGSMERGVSMIEHARKFLRPPV